MADKVFPANTDVMTRDELRNWLKQNARSLGDYIQSGAIITDAGGLNISVSAFKAVASGTVLERDTASTVAMNASTTNYVFIAADDTALDTVLITVNTTGTPPTAPNIKIGEVVTGGASITTIRNYGPKPQLYADVETDVDRIGILDQGTPPITYPPNANLGGEEYHGGYVNTTTKKTLALWGSSGTDGATLNHFGAIAPARGIRHTFKGKYLANADLKADVTFECFGVGFFWPAGPAWMTSTIGPDPDFARTTEADRDNRGTVAAIVDVLEDIQTYNCDNAGNASYTDSGHNADLTAGCRWEIIWATSRAGASTVTIKIEDSAGAMQTVLNAVTPAATFTRFWPVLLMNQDSQLMNVTHLVERIA